MKNLFVLLGFMAIPHFANAVMIPRCIEYNTSCGGKAFGIFCVVLILLITFFSNKK